MMVIKWGEVPDKGTCVEDPDIQAYFADFHLATRKSDRQSFKNENDIRFDSS